MTTSISSKEQTIINGLTDKDSYIADVYFHKIIEKCELVFCSIPFNEGPSNLYSSIASKPVLSHTGKNHE